MYHMAATAMSTPPSTPHTTPRMATSAKASSESPPESEEDAGDVGAAVGADAGNVVGAAYRYVAEQLEMVAPGTYNASGQAQSEKAPVWISTPVGMVAE